MDKWRWFCLIFQYKTKYFTLLYLKLYLAFTKSILLDGNQSFIRRVKLLNFFNYLKVAHCFYLAFANLSYTQRLLHFDAAYLILPKRKFNLMIAAGYLFIVIYGNKVIFFRGNIYLNTILKRLLLHKETAFFFRSPYYKRKLITQTLQRHLVVYNNVFHNVIAVAIFSSIYAYVTVGVFYFHNWPTLIAQYSWISLIFILIWQHLSAAGFLLYFVNATHLLQLFYPLCATLLHTFFIKMQQNTNFFCNHLKLNKPIIRPYSEYRRNYIETLLYFFAINRMYGRLFLSHFLTLCPISAGLTLWLLNGKVAHQVFILFLIVYSNLLIFGVHLVLTQCIRLIHAPSKLLNRLMLGKAHRVGQFRFKLRLSLDIMAIHTKQQYGFTYGKMKLITLSAFTGVSGFGVN